MAAVAGWNCNSAMHTRIGHTATTFSLYLVFIMCVVTFSLQMNTVHCFQTEYVILKHQSLQQDCSSITDGEWKTKI